MSVFISINTLCNDKILNDLVIPSCLFINPNQPHKQFNKLNLDDTLVIDEKIYNTFLNSETHSKKLTKSNKKYNKKTKKNKIK